MAIQRLSQLLINQIAAGEVIERPASVVKELVENSLDAGATRIEITIEQGGRRLVRVSDDGLGIDADQLSLAVAPHATSKLSNPGDLESIATLGFRGEAIASIASISRLRITSRATIDGQPAEAAALIEASGDTVTGPSPAASSPGTIVEVRDLFFNTPARRKFMRSAGTEFGHSNEWVTRMAMARPAVAFKLMHDRRVAIDLPPQSPRARCVALLGQELDEQLLDFESVQRLGGRNRAGMDVGENDPVAFHQNSSTACVIRVWGLAGLPAIARATSKFQYLYVNGRPVRDRSLSHAMREAYRGLMAPGQQPVAVVFLELPSPPQTAIPADDGSLAVDSAISLSGVGVDVNVHPTKAEVRFQDPNRLHGLVLTAMRQRLLRTDLTPTANLSSARPPQPSIARTEQSPSVETRPTDSFVEYFRSMAPKQKGFDYQQAKQAMHEGQADGEPDQRAPIPTPSNDPEYAIESSNPIDSANQKTAISQDQTTPSWLDNQANNDVKHTSEVNSPSFPQTGHRQDSTIPEGSTATDGETRQLARDVLQVHNSYLVTQDDDGLLIVDQHALHERVMFEQLRQRVLAGPLESQRMLTPAVVKANPARIALLESLEPLLCRIGVEAEPIGPDALAVQAFPTFLFDRKVEPDEFLNDLLDRAQEGQIVVPPHDSEGQDVEETVLHTVLDMMACKAAVKAGDRMTPQELDALLAQRDRVERSSSCPHGRPTSYRISLKQLAKEFKRT